LWEFTLLTVRLLIKVTPHLGCET